MSTYEGQCRARFRAESGPTVLPPPYPPLPEGSLNPEPRMGRERFSRRESAWWVTYKCGELEAGTWPEDGAAAQGLLTPLLVLPFSHQESLSCSLYL